MILSLSKLNKLIERKKKPVNKATQKRQFPNFLLLF